MNRKILAIVFFIVVLLVFSPFCGLTSINLHGIFGDSPSNFIFWHLRVPRVLLGFIAGAILALSGLVCQSLFKNNLATPDLLGISSGAAAGAVVALKLNLDFRFMGFSGLYVFSFFGALSAVLFIYFIARMIKNTSLYTFLMSGVAINFFYSSIIVIFQYVFDFSDTFSLLRWLMGGISVVGYTETIFLFILLLLVLAFIFLFKREFLLASAGDDFAQSRGLEIANFRLYSFLGLSFFVGAVVSICGPIGFIALVVPHVSRTWGMSRYNATVAFTFLLGGGLLVVADSLARTLIPPVEIPVGIITSLFGAPFFLLLLVAQMKKAG
jgi:iron complex transport system permease protein